MVGDPTRRRATYQDILDAPENMVAEVLDGELHLMPRPRRRHTRSASALGSFLVGAFDFGVNGPGGWTILVEPELHLGPEPDIVVLDLAGWREGRLVDREDLDEPFVTVVPDWLCEVLSPGTRRIDRMKKMPIYAREKVSHVWLADPEERSIEVFRHAGTGFALVGTYGGDDPIRAEPFDAVAIAPAFVWGRGARP
jgi:Uma2 family endonuclease